MITATTRQIVTITSAASPVNANKASPVMGSTATVLLVFKIHHFLFSACHIKNSENYSKITAC